MRALAFTCLALWPHLVHAQRVIREHAHRPAVSALAVSADGRRLASAGVDHRVRLWQLPNGAAIRDLHGHRDEVYAIAFSPDGALLASSAYDGAIIIWDTKRGTIVSRARVARWALAISFASSDTLVVGSVDGAIRLFAARSARLLSTCDVGIEVHGLALAPDLSSVVIGGPTAHWDLRNCTRTASLRGAGGVVNIASSGRRSGAPSAAATVVASAHLRGAAYVRSGTAFTVVDSAISERAASIASVRGTSRDTVRVPVSAVALSTDGRWLAYGDALGRVRAKLIGEPEAGREYLGHGGAISALVFTPDGSLLISGATDGSIRIWEHVAATIPR